MADLSKIIADLIDREYQNPLDWGLCLKGVLTELESRPIEDAKEAAERKDFIEKMLWWLKSELTGRVIAGEWDTNNPQSLRRSIEEYNKYHHQQDPS